MRQSRTSTHSIRCEDALWQKARKRAASEAITVNHVLTELLEGYAEHKLCMPTVQVIKTYTPLATE